MTETVPFLELSVKPRVFWNELHQETSPTVGIVSPHTHVIRDFSQRENSEIPIRYIKHCVRVLLMSPLDSSGAFLNGGLKKNFAN
jgi:hypothetical protein